MKNLIICASIFLINPPAIAVNTDSRRCVDDRGYVVPCPEICTIENNDGTRRQVPCIDLCYEIGKNGESIYFPCPPRD